MHPSVPLGDNFLLTLGECLSNYWRHPTPPAARSSLIGRFRSDFLASAADQGLQLWYVMQGEGQLVLYKVKNDTNI